MERFDVDGWFWLADKPNDRVAGRLAFNPVDGARLNLIGSFRDYVPTMSDPPVCIRAIAGARVLTLCECRFAGLRIIYAASGETEPVRHEYQIDVILDGTHANTPEELRTKHVLLHLRYLEGWVRGTGSEPIGYQDKVDSGQRISHTFEKFERIQAVGTKQGEFALAHGQTILGDDFLETVSRSNFYFDMRLSSPWSLGQIIEWSQLLRDLITLGLDYSSAITGITLDHPQQKDYDSAETSRPVRLFIRLVGNYIGPFNDRSAHGLFGFGEIGGMGGLSDLLGTSLRYRVVVGMLASDLYLQSPYLEHRFFSACTATEALRRVQLGKQNFNLRKELLTLAHQAGEVFREAVGDAGKWSSQVVKARNNHIVHSGLHDPGDINTINWLADSLHLLVILCLLSECGVRERVEERMRSSERLYRMKRMRPQVAI